KLPVSLSVRIESQSIRSPMRHKSAGWPTLINPIIKGGPGWAPILLPAAPSCVRANDEKLARDDETAVRRFCYVGFNTTLNLLVLGPYGLLWVGRLGFLY